MSDAAGHHSRLTIDLDALAANYRHMRGLASPAECAAVVKAHGYGIGAGEAVACLLTEGCRHFFVAQLEEGIRLRRANIEGLQSARVSVLGGLAGASPALFLSQNLIPVLSTPEEIAVWAAAARAAKRPLPAILQVETGMNRLGLSANDIAALIDNTERLNALSLVAVMSHLACADDPKHSLNVKQLRAFRDCLARFPGIPGSLANSAGILLGRDFHFDLVRPGIALFGGNPRCSGEPPMRPVVTLEARILQTRLVGQEDFVGYGATWHPNSRRRLATVGIGYADGYPRSLGNRAEASVGGVRVPVVGRISMDLTTIDVTEAPEDRARPGAWVEMIGPHIPLDEVAANADTIGYELLTSLGPRCERVYLGVPRSGDQP